MNRDIATRWVQALRSKKFTQAQSQLRRKDREGALSHCCLGVLCELAVEDGVAVRTYEGYTGTYDKTREGTSLLPPVVMEWAGLRHQTGRVPGFKYGIDKHLTELNDADKYTFDQIADVIEEHADSMD